MLKYFSLLLPLLITACGSQRSDDTQPVITDYREDGGITIEVVEPDPVNPCDEECNFSLFGGGPEARCPEREKYTVIDARTYPATRALMLQAAVMGRKHHLFLENSFVYHDENGIIDGFFIDFSSMELVELCEARHILVDVVNEILHRVNSDPALTNKLRNPPLTYEDLEIWITHKSFYGIRLMQYLIHEIVLQNGRAFYVTSESNNRELPFAKCRSEPYHKTAEIVRVDDEVEEEMAKLPQEPEKSYLKRIQFEPRRTQNSFQRR
ncbi:MAG: hypothetical protein KDK65_03230 [Chlamydiia bacterium]|nr:hypothetical protein [Chlamydiia bacterium]